MKKINIIFSSIFPVLGLLFIYLTYGSIMSFYQWSLQPRLVLMGGNDITVSLGFQIQAIIYTSFTILALVLIAVSIILYFVFKKRQLKKDKNIIQ